MKAFYYLLLDRANIGGTRGIKGGSIVIKKTQGKQVRTLAKFQSRLNAIRAVGTTTRS